MLVSGEAGIGKSRLTAALLERLSGEAHTRLRNFCSPQHTDSGILPIIGQMSALPGLAHDENRKRGSTSLMRFSPRDLDLAGECRTLAEMLSLPMMYAIPPRAGPGPAQAKNAGSADLTTG